MQHAMIDLETMGTAPGSVILTIGAVRFSPGDDDLIGADWRHIRETEPHRCFYRRVDRASCTAIGMTEDADTAAWWKKQSAAMLAEAFCPGPDRAPIGDVLAALTRWLEMPLPADAFTPLHRRERSKYPWSHGASFDVVLLEAAYRMTGQPIPWKFWDIRDTRTLYDFMRVSPERGGDHHHALADAVAQAAAVQRAYSQRTWGGARAMTGPAPHIVIPGEGPSPETRDLHPLSDPPRDPHRPCQHRCADHLNDGSRCCLDDPPHIAAQHRERRARIMALEGLAMDLAETALDSMAGDGYWIAGQDMADARHRLTRAIHTQLIDITEPKEGQKS